MANVVEHIPSGAKGQPHPGESYHPGAGYHAGTRWMPGGGSWGASGHYEGGSPHLVNPHGQAIAGQHRGKRIAVQKGRTMRQELNARAGQHARRMEDRTYKQDYEKEAAGYGMDARADFRKWVKEQGGVRPDRKRAEGDKHNPKKRDEYATLPVWAKNSKGGGTSLDDMTERAKESFPGLGIETESDLSAYMHSMGTGSGARYRGRHTSARQPIAVQTMSAGELDSLAYKGADDEYAF